MPAGIVAGGDLAHRVLVRAQVALGMLEAEPAAEFEQRRAIHLVPAGDPVHGHVGGIEARRERAVLGGVEPGRIADLDHRRTEKPAPRGELVQAPRARSASAGAPARGCARGTTVALRERDVVRHVDHGTDCKQAPVERNMPTGCRLSAGGSTTRKHGPCPKRRASSPAAATP
ncbi:MAG: hypothetical protein M5U09_00035 [Gammaproteobacteria bacterium]|nr:hypothetical protein [Gammaproteobacteria bacterium]